MSTGISEIGSHPKDVERLKHHILWMCLFYPDPTGCYSSNGKALGSLRYNSIFCWSGLSFEVVGAFDECRLLCRSRLNASDIGGGPIP